MKIGRPEKCICLLKIWSSRNRRGCGNVGKTFFFVHISISLSTLSERHLTNLQKERCIIYGEGLAYFLAATNYTVAVEAPLNIQKKFPPTGNKNDWQDSINIAEYACRYEDKLSFWQPKFETYINLSCLNQEENIQFT